MREINLSREIAMFNCHEALPDSVMKASGCSQVKYKSVFERKNVINAITEHALEILCNMQRIWKVLHKINSRGKVSS